MAMRVKNIAAGFYDSTGFHPVRSSADYDPDRAGDSYSQRSPKAKRKKKASGRKPRPKAKVHRKRNPKAAEFGMGGVQHYGDHVTLTREHGAYLVKRHPAHPAGHKIEGRRTLTAARALARKMRDEKPGRTGNPIPVKWATAKVRKLGNDIQVMLFPKGKVAKRRTARRVATGRKRNSGGGVKWHYSAVARGRSTDASFGIVTAPTEAAARKEVRDITRDRIRSGFAPRGTTYVAKLRRA